MKKYFGAFCLAIMLSGCSVYMAANSEGKKDLGVLTSGTPRDDVLAEFGSPVASIKEADDNYDIFKFTQERSDESNAGRAILYGTAAVLTLGLSEVVATPLEAVAGDAGEMQIRANYDGAGKLKTTDVRTGDGWTPLEEVLAAEREREKRLAE